jgi:hypothetical protein
MPQGPFQTVSLGVANRSALNITANTVVKATAGFVVTVVVLDEGSANGGLFDAATVGAAAAANEIFAIPQVAGTYVINFPASNGIVVKPGAGQTIAISYS